MDSSLQTEIIAALEPAGERTIVVTERDDLLKELEPGRKAFGVFRRRPVVEAPRFVQAVRFETGECLVEVGVEAIHGERVSREAAERLAQRGFMHRTDPEGRESEQWQLLLPAHAAGSLAQVLSDTAATLGLDATNAAVQTVDA